jgi:hypothetical protein
MPNLNDTLPLIELKIAGDTQVGIECRLSMLVAEMIDRGIKDRAECAALVVEHFAL